MILYRARICKRLRRPGIDSEDSIPPAYVAWRAGTRNRVVVPAGQAGNRLLGSLKGSQYGLWNQQETDEVFTVLLGKDPYIVTCICNWQHKNTYLTLDKMYKHISCVLRGYIPIGVAYVRYLCTYISEAILRVLLPKSSNRSPEGLPCRPQGKICIHSMYGGYSCMFNSSF
jgi:hypothetical protein